MIHGMWTDFDCAIEVSRLGGPVNREKEATGTRMFMADSLLRGKNRRALYRDMIRGYLFDYKSVSATLPPNTFGEQPTELQKRFEEDMQTSGSRREFTMDTFNKLLPVNAVMPSSRLYSGLTDMESLFHVLTLFVCRASMEGQEMPASYVTISQKLFWEFQERGWIKDDIDDWIKSRHDGFIPTTALHDLIVKLNVFFAIPWSSQASGVDVSDCFAHDFFQSSILLTLMGMKDSDNLKIDGKYPIAMQNIKGHADSTNGPFASSNHTQNQSEMDDPETRPSKRAKVDHTKHDKLLYPILPSDSLRDSTSKAGERCEIGPKPSSDSLGTKKSTPSRFVFKTCDCSIDEEVIEQVNATIANTRYCHC